MWTRRLASELQYVLAILKRTLQKYCAQLGRGIRTPVTAARNHPRKVANFCEMKFIPFHGFSVRGFKHRHHRARNPFKSDPLQITKSIISDPLQIHHACQRFCSPHKFPYLPHILQRVEIPAPATRKTV